MSNYHVMIDMKTFGQSIFHSPIINCAVVLFDWDRFVSDPCTFNELTFETRLYKLDIEYQLKNHPGIKILKRDVEWWETQPKQVRKQLAPSFEDLSTDVFIEQMLDYVSCANQPIIRWWSRSNCFDPVFIQRIVEVSEQYSMDDINAVLPYWNVRDVRTYIDTKFDFRLKHNTFIPIDDQDLWNQHYKQHNSVHDVAADVLRLQKLVQLTSE